MTESSAEDVANRSSEEEDNGTEMVDMADEASVEKNEATAGGGKAQQERKPRQNRGPGKVIPTLTRTREFGFRTTKTEWEGKESGAHDA